jgi:UDP-N-acetylmuramoyl-L-alanyl-D-glutamate--2,6-diaminopimelate ligase
MRLNHLFSALAPQFTSAQYGEIDISGIFNDARNVIPNSVFIAIPGNKVDGHQFIPEAIRNGAVALVVQDQSKVPESFVGMVFLSPNTREALDLLASRFYLDPGQELFCVGVTGTNGKTSVTYMIEAILNLGRIPTGVIGTVNHHLGDRVWPSEMTTPDPIFLQKRLREFRDAGALGVAMEVSSHALDQKRVDSVPFNTVVFTNLTRDHLDYHKDMESYFSAKQKLFTDLLWQSEKSPLFAIVNVADKFGRRLKIADPAIVWTYGAKDSDLRYELMSMNFSETIVRIQTPVGEADLKLPMSGIHNVLNAMAAIGVGLSAGLSLAICVSALEQFAGVPGRLQSVQNSKGLSVFVDYAHSPDALENVLLAINSVRKNIQSSARIWTIFGCGGDRDKGKRPLMAKVAVKYSDQVVVTSDNPRTEDPQQIIQDILLGIEGDDKSKSEAIVNRQEAIYQTVMKAHLGDVILIAGKGHEDYQVIGQEKFFFSDLKVAEEAIKRRS